MQLEIKTLVSRMYSSNPKLSFGKHATAMLQSTSGGPLDLLILSTTAWIFRNPSFASSMCCCATATQSSPFCTLLAASKRSLSRSESFSFRILFSHETTELVLSSSSDFSESLDTSLLTSWMLSSSFRLLFGHKVMFLDFCSSSSSTLAFLFSSSTRAVFSPSSTRAVSRLCDLSTHS